MKKCPEKATIQVPWAGEIKKACLVHANDLVILANVIGSPVRPELIITEEPCYGQDDFKERKEAQTQK